MADVYEVRHTVYRRPLREFWTVAKRQWNGLVWVRNTSGRVKHYRSAETAQAECDKLNSRAAPSLDHSSAEGEPGGVAFPRAVRLDEAALHQWLVDVSQNMANTPEQQNAAWLLLQTVASGLDAPGEGQR